jgi:hypothetical protein
METNFVTINSLVTEKLVVMEKDIVKSEEIFENDVADFTYVP